MCQALERVDAVPHSLSHISSLATRKVEERSRLTMVTPWIQSLYLIRCWEAKSSLSMEMHHRQGALPAFSSGNTRGSLKPSVPPLSTAFYIYSECSRLLAISLSHKVLAKCIKTDDPSWTSPVSTAT